MEIPLEIKRFWFHNCAHVKYLIVQGVAWTKAEGINRGLLRFKAVTCTKRRNSLDKLAKRVPGKLVYKMLAINFDNSHGSWQR